jgi:hypothetical protein
VGNRSPPAGYDAGDNLSFIENVLPKVRAKGLGETSLTARR